MPHLQLRYPLNNLERHLRLGIARKIASSRYRRFVIKLAKVEERAKKFSYWARSSSRRSSLRSLYKCCLAELEDLISQEEPRINEIRYLLIFLFGHLDKEMIRGLSRADSRITFRIERCRNLIEDTYNAHFFGSAYSFTFFLFFFKIM